MLNRQDTSNMPTIPLGYPCANMKGAEIDSCSGTGGVSAMHPRVLTKTTIDSDWAQRVTKAHRRER